MTGYVANQQQSASTISGISAVYFLIPAIASAISCIVFYFGYDLTDEKHDAIVKELERRDSMKAKEASQLANTSETEVASFPSEAAVDSSVINH